MPPSVDHDLKPGPIDHCQICGSTHLREVIDLGHQPPCDSLLQPHQLAQPEVTYPLRLMQCDVCSLAQLDYLVPAEEVYAPTYPYRAGLSWPVVAAHREMAKNLVKRFGPGHYVDIGSNDGTLLAELKTLGCGVTGVEPTNIADVALAAGVPTVKAFFNEAAAKQIGVADVITMTNVFAHMGALGEVMRGIRALLGPGSVLVIENHYLVDIFDRSQFDTIYHEHVRTYTLKSLMRLFDQYDMEVFDVERVPRYGGNIRVYAAPKGYREICSRVGEVLNDEAISGAYTPEAAADFRSRVYRGRDKFMAFATGKRVYGCSAPGRASTLLNFYGVDRHVMPWTGELEGSFKIGKHLPGCHIPVVSNRRIVEEQPEHLVLLAWHYANEIAARLEREGVRSKLIIPLPHLIIRH